MGYNKDMVKNTPKVRHLRYEALRRSLIETVKIWPYIYEHKIIGKNADTFKDALKVLETSFPLLNKKSMNLSKNGTYLSLTYEFRAKDVDEIISLWIASEDLQDSITVF